MEMVEIKTENLSVDEIVKKLKNPKISAIITYLGTVRDTSSDGEKVERLEFSYHQDMKEELEKIRTKARDKFDIADVGIIHRVGSLEVGENILLIAVSAAHRKPAFKACKFIIDEIKYLHDSWRKEKIMAEKIRVTKNTTLSKILKVPGAKDILSKYRLPCLHCPMAALEMGKLKIGRVTEAYGIKIDSLLEELNRIY